MYRREEIERYNYLIRDRVFTCTDCGKEFKPTVVNEDGTLIHAFCMTCYAKELLLKHI